MAITDESDITTVISESFKREDLLNANRFLKIAKGYLSNGDKAFCHTQLINMLSTATLIGNSLKGIVDSNNNVKTLNLISQYKMIQEELLTRLQSSKKVDRIENIESDVDLYFLNLKDPTISPCLSMNDSPDVHESSSPLSSPLKGEQKTEIYI